MFIGSLLVDAEPTRNDDEQPIRLKPGERSAPVEIGGWFSIVRKDAEHAGVKRTFAEAYDDVERTVRANTAKRLHEEWMKRLRDRAFIVIYEMPGM